MSAGWKTVPHGLTFVVHWPNVTCEPAVWTEREKFTF